MESGASVLARGAAGPPGASPLRSVVWSAETLARLEARGLALAGCGARSDLQPQLTLKRAGRLQAMHRTVVGQSALCQGCTQG